MTEQLEYELVERSTEPGVFSVEAIDYKSGDVFVTNFYGSDSEARAKEYWNFKQSMHKFEGGK